MPHLLSRLIAVALCALPIAAAHSADFPTRPIRLVVPFAPGGVTDTGARIVADKLGQRLGQTVVVENRPGAAGNIGTQAVVNAEPDGYTLVVGFDGTIVINPHVYAKIGFDPLKDFTPVSKIGDAVLILVANPKVPVKTLQELIAYSKAQPNGVSYGSAGTGSTPHLGGELFKLRTGAKLEHIPYKGGGQAMTDVVGGTIPLLYTAVAGAYPFVQKDQVRALAVSSKQRLASLPDVPTFEESGVPDFEVNSWIGILAPKGTPAAITKKLQENIRAVVMEPATRERLAGLGIVSSGNTPEEFGQQIREDLAKYEAVVKQVGIKVDGS